VTTDWPVKTLGEVLFRTETVNPAEKPATEFEYVDVSAISNETFQITETQRLKGKDAPSRARRLIRTDDVLFATVRPTLQRIAIVPAELDGQVCSTGYFVMRAKPGLDHRWLFYSLFTESFTSQMEALQKGASYPAVNDSDVRAQTIALPPLAEQRRIVAILDEAFAAIATAKANTEQNLANARTVLNSYLDTLLRGGEAIWPHRRLGDIVTRLTNGYVGPTRNIYLETGVPYLLARHVKNNRLAFDGRTFVSDEFNRKHNKSTLKSGDVLLVQSGHIGHSAVVPAEHAGHNCHAMIVITPVEGVLTGPYLSLLFNSIMRPQLEAIKTGSTVPHLNCGSVIELPVPLPEVSIQRDLVCKSNLMSEELNRLESLAQQKLAALDALRTSLLHHAFTGQLTRGNRVEVTA
jgi:type I restriction enzyme S subunit